MVQHLRVGAPWVRQEGKCVGTNPSRVYDPFFGIEDEEETGDLEPAVTLCNGTADGVVCPIRDDCLIFALTNNEKWGCWGGTTPNTRKAIRRQWPLRSGKVPRPEWHWMTEEAAMAMLTDDERAAILAEKDMEDA